MTAKAMPIVAGGRRVLFWVGGWVGGWVGRKVEANEVVRTSYCGLWVGGWVGGWETYQGLM